MKNAITAIQQIFKNVVSNASSPLYGVKKVFFGDPVNIPETDLPALAIQPISTNYNQRGSRYDQKNYSIEIRLIYNQRQYFWKEMGTPKAISAGSFSGWVVTFTVTGHGLTAGSTIAVEGCSPNKYDWTYFVKNVIDANSFRVDKTNDPGTFVSGWVVKQSNPEKVFSIEDAINKVEAVDDNRATAELTVCGTIEKNPSLPFVDANGITRNAADLSKVVSVNYSFTESRWFPTFEVVTTIEVIAVGDR